MSPELAGGCATTGVLETAMGFGSAAVKSKAAAAGATTGAAAIRLGRRFLGWEMNSQYVAIASKRLTAAREQLELGL